ncbi:MAG: hypothetical protein KIS96_13350 [Bauldia sp.]|nr:hypothetical protein [Bauldia sp.]
MKRFAAALAALLLAAPAAGQPSQASSYILVAGYADKGEACGLIEPWEAAAMRAEARRFLVTFPDDERRSLLATAAASTERLTCGDEAMVEWLAAARAGIAREWLPQHLALFRALADMDRVPLAFLATALPIEFAPAIVAIDRQFADWQASGAWLEGAPSQEEFFAAMRNVAIELTQALSGAARTPFSADEAAAILAEAGLIGRLWLLAQATEVE